ncbi:YkvA family protein [Pseudomonas palleroniana]
MLLTPANALAAQWISVFVVAYALSPIDLIPDFIPVLDYLDDMIILPLGILLAIRLMPAQVLEDCQRQASEWENSRRTARE